MDIHNLIMDIHDWIMDIHNYRVSYHLFPEQIVFSVFTDDPFRF